MQLTTVAAMIGLVSTAVAVPRGSPGGGFDPSSELSGSGFPGNIGQDRPTEGTFSFTVCCATQLVSSNIPTGCSAIDVPGAGSTVDNCPTDTNAYICQFTEGHVVSLFIFLIIYYNTTNNSWNDTDIHSVA
jgi:hypothetical protein